MGWSRSHRNRDSYPLQWAPKGVNSPCVFCPTVELAKGSRCQKYSSPKFHGVRTMSQLGPCRASRSGSSLRGGQSIPHAGMQEDLSFCSVAHNHTTGKHSWIWTVALAPSSANSFARNIFDWLHISSLSISTSHLIHTCIMHYIHIFT